MHPDIQKAVKLIDDKIIELQGAKRALIEAFGERIVQVDNKTSLPFPSLRKTKSTRRQTIVKLLREEGPLTRPEIVQKTGFPLGTISFVLNDKTTFNNKEGKWQLVAEGGKQKEKGLTLNQ